ncbi:hypothetical protein COBT_002872, partial [Conglomerata obtusa]
MIIVKPKKCELDYEIEIHKLFLDEFNKPCFKIDKKSTTHEILYKIGQWSVDAIYNIKFFDIQNEVLYDKTNINEYLNTENCTY